MTAILGAASLAEFIGEWVGSPEWGLAIAAFIHAFILINVFALAPFIFIWLERKVSGRIQDRLGPTRVGGRFGWLQGLADGGKLIQKEDLVPKAADAMLFRMAPYLACIAAFGTFMVLPFSGDWVAVASDLGLFLLVAILSLEVLGIILAGYSSGSKWSLFGGMREAAQMVSYEIPLAISALVPIVTVGSLNLAEIGNLQVSAGLFDGWLIFNNPFTFIAFFVYFTVATAGCKRAPFDLAEAESELVGGFHTEYSGMRWSFFFMAEYAAMFVVSGLASILFLGGWQTGIGFIDQEFAIWRYQGSFGPWLLANLVGTVVFVSKASLLVFVQIWIRWTLPRLRIDQVMITCLKYLIPISCVLFLGAILWPLALIQTIGRTTVVAEPMQNRIERLKQEARGREADAAIRRAALPAEEQPGAARSAVAASEVPR
jgi:NADH-quinone oxidoreductase subunit H